MMKTFSQQVFLDAKGIETGYYWFHLHSGICLLLVIDLPLKPDLEWAYIKTEWYYVFLWHAILMFHFGLIHLLGQEWAFHKSVL